MSRKIVTLGAFDCVYGGRSLYIGTGTNDSIAVEARASVHDPGYSINVTADCEGSISARWDWVGAQGTSPSETVNIQVNLEGHLCASGGSRNEDGWCFSCTYAYGEGLMSPPYHKDWNYACVYGEHTTGSLGDMDYYGPYISWTDGPYENASGYLGYAEFAIVIDTSYQTTAGASSIYAGAYLQLLAEADVSSSGFPGADMNSSGWGDMMGYASVSF